jgi:tRNA U34 5-methylaminomethyl-2-thiouridine-forming methyltransferase MnmC
MDVEIIQTKDGSHTLYSAEFDEIYHSRHGALTESEHIFIRSGLDACTGKVTNIFEVGFGTGLNALLSWVYAESRDIQINYHSIELYPVSPNIISQINYPDIIGHRDKFQKLHDAQWNEMTELSPHFSLHKINASILDLQFPSSSINVIYFDAFSPEKQPELWTVDVFAKMYDMLVPGGILVTYCSKSYVRKNMQKAGLEITKLPGPPGKRDMVRAIKASSDRS